jgi:hypothetical protein
LGIELKLKKLISLLLLAILLALTTISCGPDTPPTPKETELLQEGNELPRTQLQTKQSSELEYNRIGFHAHALWNPGGQGIFPEGELDVDFITELGVKHARLGIKSLDVPTEDLNEIVKMLTDQATGEPEFSIDPSHDDFITSLAENDLTIRLVLSFWDVDYVAQGGEINTPRFKTEGEIERYLDYVRFMVNHFKDRIEYYEIWNEYDNEPAAYQWMEPEDYLNLVRRAVPVIREEYPEAKIVVGSTTYPICMSQRQYLFSILESDVMPLVDVVAWHAMGGASPGASAENNAHPGFYYEYPSIVQEIKDTAYAHGFTGEFFCDEMHWQTHDQSGKGFPSYSETQCAKYLARGIIMHLGMDVSVTVILLLKKPEVQNTFQNLCTVMAGAEPASLSVEIDSEADNIASYAFSLSNGDKLLALWIDGTATDGNPSIEATLTFPEFSAQKVIAIDVLNGIEQELITSTDDGDLVINNLLVKDYPIILRLTP